MDHPDPTSTRPDSRAHAAAARERPGHDASTRVQPDDPRRLRIHRVPLRDVPYVPTDEPVVMAMLRFAGVTASDVVHDLGCGDGRIVIAAAKHCGARGVGVDIDPVRIAECRENARRAGVIARTHFVCGSFFDADLRDATVVMLYLLPGINVRLRPKLLRELRPGTRIVANYFEMGDWTPDMRAEAHHRTLLQWIVPAWVAGRWDCTVNDPVVGRHRIVLRLRRHNQIVTGSAHIGRDALRVLNGRLFGEHLTFKLPDPRHPEHALRYACHVHNGCMRGTCHRDTVEDAPAIIWGGVCRGAGDATAR